MNLDTIVIDPEEARARADEYAAAARETRDAEDAAMAQGYRAAARGLPIIQLSTVMAAGGTFDDGLPRLAIARATAKTVRVEVGHPYRPPESTAPYSAHLSFLDDPESLWWSSRSRARHVGVRGVNVTVEGDAWASTPRGRSRGQTMVPSVPPRFRPKRGRLQGCHVLWEVERWDPTPPVDPALLRHIRGDLWTVLAVWDLTPLERAVLAQR